VAPSRIVTLWEDRLMGTIPIARRGRARWASFLQAALATLGLAGCVQVSPWPSVLLIRSVFDSSGQQASAALEKHVPTSVGSTLNLQYDVADPQALLDVYRLTTAADHARLPTIVWIHGGGFIAGTKAEIANYARILAARGYVVVAVDYSVAPEAKYPTPVVQVNRALGYLLANAQVLHIDGHRFVLAGDSAGAQIAAQVANLISSPDYAEAMGIVPALTREQLRGTILFCGPFDAELFDLKHPSWFISTVLRSYTGRADYWNMPRFDKFSVVAYVTSDFPPTFISVGNDDPLQPHSYRMAQALEQKNVRVDSLFYSKDHVPPLPHEYQFNLDDKDGQEALRRMDAFLRSELKQP